MPRGQGRILFPGTDQRVQILKFGRHFLDFRNFVAFKNHGTFMGSYRLFRSLFGPCHFDVEHGLDYPLENPNIYY